MKANILLTEILLNAIVTILIWNLYFFFKWFNFENVITGILLLFFLYLFKKEGKSIKDCLSGEKEKHFNKAPLNVFADKEYLLIVIQNPSE